MVNACYFLSFCFFFYNNLMRLWSIHPSYLDPQGLVALWREALLAKSVLEGKTKGYKNHPQLIRFKNYKEPLIAINSYLHYILIEAKRRGYNFCEEKVEKVYFLRGVIPVTKGQLEFEFKHLCNKLKGRDEDWFDNICRALEIKQIEPHPLFYVVDGEIEEWEKVKVPDF